MKQLLFLFLIVFHFSITAMGQLPKFTYCEIFTNSSAMSNKVTIEINYGDTTKLLYNTRYEDPGVNPSVFTAIMKSINVMAKDGWELVQVYTTQLGYGTNGRWQYHYILKKQKL